MRSAKALNLFSLCLYCNAGARVHYARFYAIRVQSAFQLLVHRIYGGEKTFIPDGKTLRIHTFDLIAFVNDIIIS